MPTRSTTSRRLIRSSDEFNVLSIEQLEAIAAAARTQLLSALFRLAAFTGLRQGELLALRWQHIDGANRILHVRRNLPSGTFQEDTPKSHRRRTAPLSDQALAALTALRAFEHFTAPDDLVFASDVGGHLLDDAVRDAFYAALDAAGLGALREKDNPIVFHDLRHSLGTTCGGAGHRPAQDQGMDGPRGHQDDDALPLETGIPRRSVDTRVDTSARPMSAGRPPGEVGVQPFGGVCLLRLRQQLHGALDHRQVRVAHVLHDLLERLAGGHQKRRVRVGFF
jgi:hypothetical protein